MITLQNFSRDNEVQYFDEWKGELTKSQKHKAEQLINYDCVRYIGNGTFIVLPLNLDIFTMFLDFRHDKKPFNRNYNNNVHVMVKDPEYGWRCTCQGYVTKEKSLKAGLSPNKPFCSHLYSLMLSFKANRFSHERKEVNA